MCIVAFAWQVLDDTPLCLISNRDEFYQRPTVALQQWEHSPIVAGEEFQSRGTMEGGTESRRWGGIKKFLKGGDQKNLARSRISLCRTCVWIDNPTKFVQLGGRILHPRLCHKIESAPLLFLCLEQGRE